MKSKVTLYLFDLTTVSQQEVHALKVLLNPEQKDKYESINNRKQTEFVISRSLLNFAVKKNLKNTLLSNNQTMIDIQERPQLPPLVNLAEENNIQFSISHSQSLIGIAIGQNMGAIGFDLQGIKTFSNTQNFSENAIESARFFCNEPQLSALLSYIDESNDNGDRSLFSRNYTKLWAKKEAYLKSLHCGINSVLLKKTHFIKRPDEQGLLCATVFEKTHDTDFIFALFCEKPYSIVCHSLNLQQLKFQTNKSALNLNWDVYDVES